MLSSYVKRFSGCPISKRLQEQMLSDVMNILLVLLPTWHTCALVVECIYIIH